MAQQLRARGQRVAFLAVLNSPLANVSVPQGTTAIATAATRTLAGIKYHLGRAVECGLRVELRCCVNDAKRQLGIIPGGRHSSARSSSKAAAGGSGTLAGRPRKL